jgi:hypothetical protein
VIPAGTANEKPERLPRNMGQVLSISEPDIIPGEGLSTSTNEMSALAPNENAPA